MPEGFPQTRSGLSEREAAWRLKSEGYNELPRSPKRTLLRIVREIASEPMFELLIAAAAIYLVLGDLGEALMLGASAIIRSSSRSFRRIEPSACSNRCGISRARAPW